jgi:hypothetical protein
VPAHDPIEDDPDVARIIQKVDRLVRRRHMFRKKGMGYCHEFWAEKKRILRLKYGIEWRSPQEMNPGTMFD